MKSIEQRNQLVEAICTEGCKFVNQFLASQGLQGKNALLQSLDQEGQQWVLNELRGIMNVYSDSGSCSL